MALWRPLVAEVEAAWLRTVLGRAPACFRAGGVPADPAGSAAARRQLRVHYLGLAALQT